MDELPPYEPNSECAKCGYEGRALTKYLAYGRCSHPDMVIGEVLNERLHRSCFRCDYQWDEAIVQAAVNA